MKLDFQGLACPMPIIRLKKFLAEHQGEQLDVELTLTDKGGVKDIPAFCQLKGLQCDLVQSEPVIVFNIKGLVES